MPTLHTGSCLCGAVRYSVSGTFTRFYLCHCSYCRKDTGSAHAANLFAPGGVLSFVAGEAQITSFTLPGTRHGKSFCSICGSALPRASLQANLVIVPAGSLDSPVEVSPTGHIFVASRADWDDGFAQVPQSDRFPS